MELTPKQKKIAYIAGGVAVAAIIVYAVWPKNDSGTVEDPTGNGTGSTAVNDANFDATAVANELLKLMSPTLANHKGVMDVLRSLTVSQFSKVVTAFGSKPYNTIFGNQLTCLWCDELTKKPLKTWLASELWEDEYNFLKLKFKSLNYL